MKKIDAAYLSKKINQLNKKIHRAESQGNDNKTWWRKMKLSKLKHKLKKIIKPQLNIFLCLFKIDFIRSIYTFQFENM